MGLLSLLFSLLTDARPVRRGTMHAMVRKLTQSSAEFFAADPSHRKLRPALSKITKDRRR
jgi:hypothetical protein